ncbi:MAG: TIGR03086 family protein [Ktedonobacterales bacterium]|nr:TIGR03086 family protein [Ktedonobacterales bacterium]
MSEPDVFIMAEQAFTKMVDQIRADQWDLLLPSSAASQPGTTLRQQIQHHAYDDSWVPDTLSGKTIAEVGDTYAGDLLGTDPKASWHTITERTQAAVRAFHDLDRIVHLSYGDFPARDYLKHISGFRGLQAWDLARFIGADDRLPDDLVQGLWDELAPEAEMWRQWGVFGARVDVPDDAPLQDRLLGLTGRKP